MPHSSSLRTITAFTLTIGQGVVGIVGKAGTIQFQGISSVPNGWSTNLTKPWVLQLKKYGSKWQFGKLTHTKKKKKPVYTTPHGGKCPERPLNL